MSRTFQREFRTHRDAVRKAGDDLTAWLDAESIPASAALVARLALDELVANVRAHGGHGPRDPHAPHHSGDEHEATIGFACVAAPDHLVVRVDDDGLPFDPRQVPSPDLEAPVGDRPVGGLGLHLLRRLSSRFDYERRDGRNRVTLVADYNT